ncbi:hypothetical protein N7454_005470 [Penicillium verhagenii]|nr:hypothetical protein N7454_005470 [Penicillium verhagenii]
MLSTLAIVLASAATIVSGQSTPTIDPNSVPLPERENWCNSQIYSCPILCLQTANSTGALVNNCSPKTLEYECECSNGVSPNATEFSQTMSYYICTEANNQCVAKCADAICQEDCRSDHPCGAQNPIRVNVTTTATATATAKPSAKAATTTTTSTATSTSTATGGAAATDMGHVYGLCLLVGSFVAGFAALI